MSTLLVWRQKLQEIFAKYSTYILKALQFILGLLVFGLINSNIGFMKMASSVFCTAGLAVICTFFPMIVMVTAAAVLIIIHFYSLSLPIAAVSLVIFLIMYIFYFRFTPGKAWIVLLSAIAFGMKVPFVIPVIFGLMGTPVWVVPAACGVIAYYMISFVKDSATALRNTGADGMVSNLTGYTRQVIMSKEMWLMVAVVILGILVVNLIRTRAVDHAWKIASASGAAVCVIAASAGNIALDAGLSYVSLILSAVLGIGVGFVLEFLFFSVDYSRTENIQFEDDEYYYYVKAVPKIGVSVPEKEVKHITGSRPETDQNEKTSEETVTTNTEEILLTRSLSKELGLDQDNGKAE